MAWIERCLFEENISHSEENPSKQSFLKRQKWVMVGFAMLIFGISFLEYRQPYYFVQDDNFAQFLSVVLEGCRAFMKGAILDWSPYQFLGFPVASTGEYALTYPPTYFSFIIARYLLGNELLTLDVFCILHLVAGYFAAYWLLWRNKLHPFLAAAGSLSFILSGYTLIAGRSWFPMIASVVWIPLLFLSVTVLKQGNPGWKWIIGTGSMVGIFFHAGHAQMWMYAIMFFLFSLTVLFCSGQLSFRKVLYAIPALLFGLAIAMPLLIPQWSIVRGIPRDPFLVSGIPYKGIGAMLLPFPFIRAPFPETSWGTVYDQGHLTPFYYSGTIFFAVFLGAILAISILLLFGKNKRLLLKRFIADNIWIILALLALVLAMGHRGLLWTIQAQLPIFNKFRMPFKFLHYFNLFAVMGGGVIIERCLRTARKKELWALFLGTAVCSLMLYHVSLSSASFYSYGDRPSRLQSYKDRFNISDFSDRGNIRRVLSLTSDRSPKSGYVFSLNHNFPTFFHVHAFGGYDYFIDKSPYFSKAKENLFSRPSEAAIAYGIRWVVIDRDIEEKKMADARSLGLASFLLAQGVKRRVTPDYVLVRLNNAHPLVFVEGHPRGALPFSVKNNGLDIDTSRILIAGGRIVINMLWRPEIMVMHGKEKLKCEADLWGRVVAEVPAQVKIVSFRYLPPWKAGFAGGILCLAGAIAAYFLLRMRIL
ncbi:MAG TPA: hypothetical protein PL155_03835 [Candidatus Omnitrophota bacterium]|nr:hypothetical protein [Candidatus Omnitrophota bacterium]HPD84395.1 hypothetical protein [Candidatus Omnitrophota bacterium]HRZ03253.1 hypothetical protein [Candidatus Omnitrophota bacterium]